MVNIHSFEKEVRILDNLPSVLTDIDEIKAVANVEDTILSAEWSLLDGALNNQFVITSNEDGVSRYERMLGLIKYDTDTLETRIFRILARYQEQAPFTWIALHRILDSLLGVGKYAITRDVAAKKVDIKIELTVIRQFDVIADLLERILPQNMNYEISIRYNTYSKLRPFTHQDLSVYTHTQLREEPM